MLKVRIIPTLLYKKHGLVKGIGFDSWRRIGTALPTIRVYSIREVDEIIFLDICATQEGRLVDIEEVDLLADECFMPLTVGGGVTTTVDFQRILRAGADKVAVNSGAVKNPALIDDAASRFGSQCVVVSIDFRRNKSGCAEVFTNCGSTATGKDVVSWSKEVESRGAGEILLTSVERDGTMEGYDIEIIQMVSNEVSIPVIASGGVGNYEQMLEALIQGTASALAAASIFHFTSKTPLEAKRFLRSKDIAVRL
jgi:imidazole glycerol-phosphate synthase subunit HisF